MAHQPTDLGAALTGLIVGGTALFAIMFAIVMLTNAKYAGKEHAVAPEPAAAAPAPPAAGVAPTVPAAGEPAPATPPAADGQPPGPPPTN